MTYVWLRELNQRDTSKAPLRLVRDSIDAEGRLMKGKGALADVQVSKLTCA